MAHKRPTSHILGLLLAVVLVGGSWLHHIYLDEARQPLVTGADLVRHAYPTATFLHAELGSGNLPLWNPYQMAGQPMMAMHVTGVLYPPNMLLMALLPAARALEASTLLHLAIAAYFTWLFAGSLGLGTAARIVAMVGYSLSSALLMGVYQFPCLMVEAWLPAILWAVHGLASEARPRWALALVVVLCHAFLGGYAQGFMYALLLALPYGVTVLFAVSRREARLRVAALALGAGGLALALVAPQLLPTLELSTQSVRSLAGLSYPVAARLAATHSLLFDGLLGPLAKGIGADGWSPLRWRLALPILTLPLFVAGFWARRQRSQWIFFAAAALVSGLFAVGADSFVFRIFYSLPGGNLFRAPIYIAFEYAFCAAIVLAIGIEGLSSLLEKLGMKPRHVRIGAGVVAALVCADVYSRSALDVEHPAVDRSIGSPPELVEFLSERPGRERAFLEIFGWNPEFLAKLGMMNDVFVLPDYESNMPSVYGQMLGVENDVWHGELSVLSRAAKIYPRADPRTLDFFSVRFYAALPTPGRGMPWRLVRNAGGSLLGSIGVAPWLVERRDALPRVYVVGEVVFEDELDDVFERLRSEAFDPQRQAVVLREDGAAEALPGPRSDEERAGDVANIAAYETERVRVEARCSSACLLVLTDLHYPGWYAHVDGEPAELLRVNGLFRGVVLEPGSHEVVYQFAPRSFRLGLLMASGGFVSIAGCAGLIYWRARDTPRILSS